MAGEFVPGGDLLDKNKVYTYPSPAKGDSMYFKFYLGSQMFVFDSIWLDINVTN